MSERRGRARSQSYSDADMDFQKELSEATGLPVPPAPTGGGPSSSSSSSSSTAAGGGKGGLSQKTIQTLTRLDVALAPPKVEGVDEDGGSTGSGGGGELDEEAQAEAELAAQERRRREGGGTGVEGGGAAAPKGRNRKVPEVGTYDVQVKLLLLGDSGVGKTSLMTRFSEDKFSSTLLSTAGVDYKIAYQDIEGKRVKCQIWDTAGQSKFHVITHSYYKNAQGIILVYDVSEPSENSFNNVQYWMENIAKHANPTTRKLLVGNKIDVKGKKISTERGKAVADQYGMRFMETSAKEGTNVREGFTWLARDVVESMFAQGLLTNPSGGGGAAGVGGEGGGKAGGGGGGKKECILM